jgi:hypothetical protein
MMRLEEINKFPIKGGWMLRMKPMGVVYLVNAGKIRQTQSRM